MYTGIIGKFLRENHSLKVACSCSVFCIIVKMGHFHQSQKGHLNNKLFNYESNWDDLQWFGMTNLRTQKTQLFSA